MITLTKHCIKDIVNEYPKIYESVFGEFTWLGNVPAEVYLVKDGDMDVGFVSGYTTAPKVWHLLRGGFNKDLQGRYGNLKTYLYVLSQLHREYDIITTKVCNTDIKALKMDINAGFVIIGMRVGSSGELFLELMHKEN